jgi:Lrp/AsnC family transcriptional regulator, leucine-responsive regulatory protein
MNLDRLDIALLRLLQRDCTLTSEALGAHIGLSHSACARRIRALQRAGVIESQVATVKPAAVGLHTLMLVTIVLDRESAEIVDAFKRDLAAAPEVMSAFSVTGESDYIVLLAMPDVVAYEAFTRNFLYNRPFVRSVKGSVVIDTIKHSLALPLPTSPDD